MEKDLLNPALYRKAQHAQAVSIAQQGDDNISQAAVAVGEAILETKIAKEREIVSQESESVATVSDLLEKDDVAWTD